MQSRHKYTQESREGWAEMIRQEVERTASLNYLFLTFLKIMITIGPGNNIKYEHKTTTA